MFLQIVGLGTNIRFLDDLAGHPEFQLGHVHTGFIAQHRDGLFVKRELSSELLCPGALAFTLLDAQSLAKRFDSSRGSRFICCQLFVSLALNVHPM